MRSIQADLEHLRRTGNALAIRNVNQLVCVRMLDDAVPLGKTAWIKDAFITLLYVFNSLNRVKPRSLSETPLYPRILMKL
jgi:hypothetical protein